ncbi:MAG: type II toxin-antitoxin system ParD family antitoxin [Pseudomonadota bacterium]
MSAVLGKPLEAFVEARVKSGRYGSRSEVLRMMHGTADIKAALANHT